ncbi:MAG: phosphopantetheine-binding protein [Deltaproteobacteria bacterium]
MTRDEVYVIVKKYLLEGVEDLKEDMIDPEKSMKDLGANSLDIVEVVSRAMRELKVKVPRSELSKLSNINALVDLLYKVVSEKPAAT